MMRLTVSDENGGSASTTQAVTVANAAPERVTISGPTAGDEGQALSFTGSATDPAGTSDTLAYNWTVAKGGVDGFAAGNGISFSFTPNDNRTYVVRLTASDEDGGTASTTRTVIVGPEPGKRQSDAAKKLGVEVEHEVHLGGGVVLRMVLVPPGEFSMGCRRAPDDVVKLTSGSAELFEPEHPLHRVRITKAFLLGKYEVTQEQWEAMMGQNPSERKGPKYPVGMVNWSDCQAFITKLNEKFPDRKFRLPTEAEWEYACRADTETLYSFGDDRRELSKHAWYRANALGKRHAVGQKKPNAWGFHDMHGSSWEWCSDRRVSYPASLQIDPVGIIDEPKRLVRGGSWNDDPCYCRSAYRPALPDHMKADNLSLRLLCTIP